jgi:acyl-CoA reductase-like NAD-dependent aldehyde dehydrogenase
MADFDPFGRQIFTDGGFAASEDGGALEVVDPATLETVGRIADSGPADIARVLASAGAAQRTWAGLDAKARAAALHQVAESIEKADPEGVCAWTTREMGKPYPEAVGELANVPTVFRYYAELARHDAGQIAGPIQPTTFQFHVYEPYGVSVHIVPYNFPIILFAWAAAASLAAGNAVVLKPSELTTLCSLKFMEHFTCLPAGLVSCLPGGPAVGQALVEAEDTHVVAFTGSVAVGRQVAEACGRQMKPCVIEAGGNDPMIVTASVPVEVSAAGAVCAAFHLAGQICTSAERLFVLDEVHDAFVEEFVTQARALRVGNGFEKSEIGPLATQRQRDKVAGLVEGAVAQGARVACGGRVPPERNVGWFYEPTVLTEVSPDMAIMQAELFGPAAPVCRVKDLDEAIGLANRSDYGLGATIFTTRTDEAMRAAKELQAGMVWINNPLVDNDALPFGGRKSSGLGRVLGRQGLDAFRQTKYVTLDPAPIRHDWWYPHPDETFYKPKS